jgi:hypothetical protein
VDFSGSLRLSEKLRSVSLHKLNKNYDNNIDVSEKIFSEISKIFFYLDSERKISYLGASVLGDQLAVAIKEIKNRNLPIEPIESHLLKISSLI